MPKNDGSHLLNWVPMFITRILKCAAVGITALTFASPALAGNPLMIKTDQGKVQGKMSADGSKGYAAVAVAKFLARSVNPAALPHLAILAGLFVILGHIFPVWLHFKGGKGVATAFGVFLALCPLAALAALGLWIAVVLLTRYVSLASILAAVVLPFLTLWLSPGRYGYASGAAVFVCCWIVIVKHHQNIVRLLQGTEHGFGASRKTGA
jgi:glycerol-3-phosphate acyltransferase PlsY